MQPTPLPAPGSHGGLSHLWVPGGEGITLTHVASRAHLDAAFPGAGASLALKSLL